jgi:hypothetical protein
VATYGVDVYGKALYGTDLDIDYTVANLAAVQSDYGRVTLSWDSPPLSDWTSLTLVRSQYGYPVAVTDGVILAVWPSTGTHTLYDDVDLPPGYWYYTLFLASPFTAWSAALTYVAGDRVGYGGSVWYCVAPITTNVTPGTNSAVWLATSETTLYRPAGSVSCLAVRDYGYGALLDSLVPSPYKILPGISTDTITVDSELTQFLDILGFGFAQANTELDDLLEVYDVTTTRQDRLYEISATLGLSSEIGASARFQRLRALKAAKINQERGTTAGIRDTIAAATGLAANVATGANLMLSQDQSAFLSPPAMAWNPAEPYQLGDQVVYLGARYTCTGFNLSITQANYVADSVVGSPNALATTSVTGTTVVKETSASAPATITVPFTVLANGSYQAVITTASGPDYGIISATLDGAAVQVAHFATVHGGFGYHPPAVPYGPSIDMYYTSTLIYGNVTTFPTALSAGSHTFVFQCTAKNASASAYNLAFALVTISGSPVLYPPGNPPTGASTSAAQWTVTAASTDNTTYLNPVTGGMGTWTPLTTMTLATGYLGG